MNGTRRAPRAGGRHAPDVERRRAAHAALVAGGVQYPDALPITARRGDLLAAIGEHQVVIVAGETGSGKSTQLPKLCLELGRGVDGLIGHTQPRRVAARAIAERVADELGTRLGAAVGYTVRFNDRVGEDTLVRVMTDGILLGEIQRDRLLRRYDTLIIDEAHERSLNIDFILGYLRQLLFQRPELKLIVTSATIDTARFAGHFARDGVDATVIEVAGRTYPVELRYRPYGDEVGGERDDRDQVQAVVDAVEELSRDGPGDVLVFLSGEREIHDTADALRRLELRHTDVLPLYARLSSAEQHRIFAPHTGRRIVISTNVAETSLTVPGVRYVVDAGTARISRYSRRLKVQRLPIEPISQASADQRAGRCGRVAPGVCIRLLSKDDFDERPEFTEPEILRTNLASVILQMTAIGLGDVAAFPFLEPPDAASVRDGYVLLEELAAIQPVDARGRRGLTAIGRRLARLPVDPRLGRMVLQAERHGCVREVLVIAAALSIRDPRERPEEVRAAADELHRRFDVPGSDLLSIVALWDHLRAEQRQRSSNQFRRMCRREYLNYLRVREWQDLFSQLRQVAGDLGIRAGHDAGHPDHVHQSVLAGLLSHVGMRDGDRRELRGARGASFVIAPGSVLARTSPRWVMAAELVETNRLWARRVASIQPEWAERVGAHLVKRSYGEPRWDARGGRAVTSETVTLYGLPIVAGRIVGYDRVDRGEARAMFIRHALVDGESLQSDVDGAVRHGAEERVPGGHISNDWSTHHGFIARNRQFVADVGALEARLRRGHLLDDEIVFNVYDRRLPDDIVSTRHFDRWWKRVVGDEPDLLDFSVADLRDPDGVAVRLDDYPDTWTHGKLTLPLTYRFDPGGPLDGVTVRIPLTAINQMTGDGFDWHIPGYRAELVQALVRTLPKDVRRALIPAAETTQAALERLGAPDGLLVDALARALGDVAGVPVRAANFGAAAVPAHLRVNFVVTDDSGAVHDADTDLGAIRTRLATTVREAIADASPIDERRGIVDWDVGALPQVVETSRAGHTVVGYPALLDDDDSVSLRVLTNADLAQRVMRGGVRRLLLLTVPPAVGAAARQLSNDARLAIAGSGIALAALAAECRVAAVDGVLAEHELPWDAEAFAVLQRAVRADGRLIAADALAVAADVLAAAARVRDRLGRLIAAPVRPSVADASEHLDRLVGPGFVVRAGAPRLPDVHRYVSGIEHRLDRLSDDVARDRRRMAEVVPLERRLAAFERNRAPGADGGGRVGGPAAALAGLGWQLQELRVSLFAQPVGVHGQVSARRIARALDDLGA